MKFTDGYWRNREDAEVYNAARVYDLETDERSVTAYAPYFDVANRGQTLMGPVLTVRFSSPMPEVIRVQIRHFEGVRRPSPTFDLVHGGEIPVAIDRTEDAVSLTSGGLTARIGTGKSWSVEFLDRGRPLTGSGWRNAGYVKTRGGAAYMKEQLALGVGECVYGLGERFTAFVKNGQVVESWNADGGTASELAYKAVPFYLTNRGYGVLVNDPGAVSFEVASEKVSRVQFSVPGEYLEYFVINGPDPSGVLRNYTALTGRPALPPAWSFGLWLTTSFVTEYDENTVTSFVEGMAKRDIPLSVFHFDCFWMREYHWTDFSWDERYFPDPEGFIARLKARGLKICVWINPYIAQRSRLFREGAAAGYLVCRPNGDVHQVDSWQPGMAMVDFTNPDARNWFASYLIRLVENGVDCFKTDFGERIPTDTVWHDGSDPERMHNYFSYLYNKTVFEALEGRLGAGNALVFARSATAGGQKFPVHWGGDCTASYESMAESLRGGLSLGLSGFGFWSHDISGFENTATPDLYKRWAAFGLLSSHSRLHGNASYRVPWNFDEESVEVLRHFVKLKCRLMPYLFASAVETVRTGLPMMRATVLEFPDDPACTYLDRQYLLGDALLVAPIFNDRGEAEFYLPEGGWVRLLGGEGFTAGEIVAGGRWMREKHGYLSLPLFARPGRIIAAGSRDDRPDYDYADRVELQVTRLSDRETARTAVYGQDGNPELSVTVSRKGDALTVTSEGNGKPWTMRLLGMSAAGATGARVNADAGGQVLVPDSPAGRFTVTLSPEASR